MNGDLGFYIIKPDQMQMIESLLMLAFIPLCVTVIHPLLYKIGIRRPLQRLVVGGILVGIAFLFSARVQYWIDSMPVKSVNMLWQIPQYIILTLADAMYAVTGPSFSYEQAPDSMKSVPFAFWLLEIGIGNFILAFITGMEFFESRVHEFIFFSALMFCSMFVFAILAYNYEKFKNNSEIELQKNEQSSNKI